MELALRDALVSITGEAGDAQAHLSSQLGLVSSLQASIAAGIPVPEASVQLALNRVQREVQELAVKKAEQQTVVAVLAEEMMRAEEARLAAEAIAFREYEEAAHKRILDLAAENGVDLAAYEQVRGDMVARRQAAIASGDTLEAYKQDALLAENNVLGLGAVNAPDEEQERARKEADAARERYLREAEIMAGREASQHGLTPEEQSAYVATARAAAQQELAGETAEIRSRYPGQETAQLRTSARVVTERNEVRGVNETLMASAEPKENPSRSSMNSLGDALAADADVLSQIELYETDPTSWKTPDPASSGGSRGRRENLP